MSIETTGRDLNQWVNGCVVKVDETGTLLSVSTSGTDGQTNEMRGYLIENGQFARTHIDIRNELVSLWWPHIGCINVVVDNILYVGAYAYRIQGTRQWRRSYTPELIRMDYPRLWDITRELGYEPNEMPNPQDAEVIAAFNKPNYPKTTIAAIKVLLENKDNLSIAVNPQTILYYNGIDSCMVFYRGDHVADLNTKTLVMECYKGGTIENRLRDSLKVTLK